MAKKASQMTDKELARKVLPAPVRKQLKELVVALDKQARQRAKKKR